MKWPFAKRATPENPATSWDRVIDIVTSGHASKAGRTVTPESSLRVSAVSAAVALRAETMASLPLITYERDGDLRTVARSHPNYKILHDRPNTEISAFQFREMMQTWLDLYGNAYAEIVISGGQVIALWPILPTRVSPTRTDGVKSYRITLASGEQVTLPAHRVLHLMDRSLNGLVGLSKIGLARESIGLAMAAEEYGARLFDSDARPGGVLEHPGKLGDTAIKNLRESWDSTHGGLQNAHRMAILEEGMKFNATSIPPDDAQFLETRKFQISDIARMFRVPPHMIGDLERATFSNVEEQSRNFVQYTALPIARRWESEINRSLFTDRSRFFAEYLFDGLLRGDVKTRTAGYAMGRQWGWLSVNDVRRLENMNPIDDGDVYLQPLNMVDASDPEPEPAPADADDEANTLRLLTISLGWHEIEAIRRSTRSMGPTEFGRWIAEFYTVHADRLARELNIDPDQSRQICLERQRRITSIIPGESCIEQIDEILDGWIVDIKEMEGLNND